METNTQHKIDLVYFSRWSRKGYAVFAALGKSVAISTVPFSICNSALLKSARKGVIVSDAGSVKENFIQIETDKAENVEIYPVCRGKVCTDENETVGNKYNSKGVYHVNVYPFFY